MYQKIMAVEQLPETSSKYQNLERQQNKRKGLRKVSCNRGKLYLWSVLTKEADADIQDMMPMRRSLTH